MFLRPEISELNDALNQHRVVVLYGLPGSGKSFLGARAQSSSFKKITELPLVISKTSGAYWFDAPPEKDFEALKKTIAMGTQSWLITSRQRLDIKDAKLMNLKALDEVSALEILYAELDRRGLRDSVEPEKILPYLLGNPQAISKAVAFLEINGADELSCQLRKEGYAFDPFLKEESKTFWDQVNAEGQKTMRMISVFSSFTLHDLDEVFNTETSQTILILSKLMDAGLIERRTDSARFHINAYGRMLVNRFSPPEKRAHARHGKWALKSNHSEEIGVSATFNAGTELGIRCLSWLIEKGVSFDGSLLEEAVEKLRNKKYAHSANLLYAHASRCLSDGNSSMLRNYILECDRDLAVREEMDALLAKFEQRFDDALLHYTNCLEGSLSPNTRMRIENNRIAVLWESGRAKDAIAEARSLASKNTGKDGAVALSNLAVMLHNEEDFVGAKSCYEDALQRHRKFDNQRYIAISYFDLGTLAHEHGQFQAALLYHEKAEVGFEKLKEKRFLILNAAAIASIRVALFHTQDGFSFSDAKRQFSIENDALFQEAILLYETIANNYKKVRLGEEPEAFDYLKYEKAPDELRVQARILRYLSTELILVCDSTGSLFSTKPDEVIFLNGSRSQRIFFNFVTRHLDGKNEIEISGIANAGWPGEVMTLKSAKNRVHVALTTLRKAGLKSVLQTTKKGYRLGLLRKKNSVALFVFPNCELH